MLKTNFPAPIKITLEKQVGSLSTQRYRLGSRGPGGGAVRQGQQVCSDRAGSGTTTLCAHFLG